MSEEARPRRLHPIVPLFSLVKQLPELAVPIVGAVAVGQSGGIWMLWLAVGALLAAVLALQVLAWWRFTYTLLPHEMYIESGVLSRNRRSIPWDRVHDVEIERGPLARIFGLAKVKLETGGSESDEGALDSIALADALALRDEIRARRGVVVSATSYETEAAPPVFEMTPLRILQAGLFNFSVLWFAVIIGVLQYFREFLPSMDEVEGWIGLHQEEIWGFIGPVTIAIAAVLFVVFGTVAGVIEMFVRNFGFTLSHEGRTLRRVRGLITRSEVAIPLHRIQAARIVTHWIKRHWGFCRVEAQTMGGATFFGIQELVPLATADEAARVLAIAGRLQRIAPECFLPVAPVHRWYDAQTEALPLALVAFVAGFFWPPLWFGIVVAGLFAASEVISARQHGWHLEGETLQVRCGWFSQEHWLLPLANIQSVSLCVGPLQRRLGLATVAIDSAGAPSKGLRIRNLAVGEARALAAILRAWRRPPRLDPPKMRIEPLADIQGP